jgi:DNA polymerase elongation subunit (family B)
MAVAFSLSEESPSSPRVFALNTKRTLVELIERQPPEEITLEDETFAVRDTLLTEKRNALLQTWLDQHRDSLNAKGELRIDSTIATGS